jgi:polysaccharide biosynthesis transport protein
VEEHDKITVYEPIPANLERQRPRLSPYEVVEADEGPDIRAYWRIIRKRIWTIATALLVVLSTGLLVTVKQKPVYQAKALLEIAKENPNILTVQELFQLENVSDNYLETQYKVLQSETLARRVIGELHLDQVKEFNRNASQALPADPETEQVVLRRFEDRLSIEPVRRSRLVQVSFESQDRQLAANVINALAANYIQENLETRWEATQKASEWLSQQLLSLKARLEKSEDELQSYAQAHGLLFLESEKGETENIVDQRLRELQDEMTKAQADRYEKESLYRLVQAGDYSALPGVVDNKLMQDLTVRLADLERQKAELTPVFSDTYPKVKETQSQIDRIEQLLAQERKRAADKITNDYLAAVRRENLVSQAFEDQRKQANLVAERSVQYNILKREVDTNRQLYEGLLQRLKEAGVSAGLKASNIRIVDAAVPPTKPVKPRIFLNLTLALFSGLSLGFGIAFLQEHLDNTLKTAEDVERFLRVPALAFIPSRESLHHHAKRLYGPAEQSSIKANGNGHRTSLDKNLTSDWIRIDASNGTRISALSEVFGSLRTSVLLSTAGKPPRSLTFVSANPSEGKTTVASNLAISLAQLGKRVLLIDGDMRRPCIHKLFAIQNHSTGLVGYLTGQAKWHQLVQHSGISELDCLVCGPIPPNPSELLSSDRMPVLIREALAEYQFVLIDAPPLLNVADGRILATMVEGAILVVKGGATHRELVQRARLHVRDVGAHLIGVVLNNVDVHPDGYYYSYYQYGYGQDGQAMRNN